MTETLDLPIFVQTWKQALQDCENSQSLEDIRLQLFGKSGLITQQLKELGKLSPELRREHGALLNAARDDLTQCLSDRRVVLEQQGLAERLRSEALDVTLPVRPFKNGKIHLFTKVIQDIHTYFCNLGFQTVEGPEIEDEYHNFDALNFPSHHPARQDHDTFYLKDMPGWLLRTHTSTTQIRTLKLQQPPLRIISTGRVYRSDALDATHTPMFHQLEGLVLEPDIHIGHLKGCLTDFCRHFFNNKDLQVRFRPSFFPFTEPSMEVDILYTNGKGEKKWLEVLGSGMVHPNVLRHCSVDPEAIQGFAFGIGVERLVMLKYGLTDIRQLYHSDQRWLDHYGQGC